MSFDEDTAARPADPEWYKDAVIYQLHVKSFMDANGDGVGDFEGLLSRLDYVQELGVTALWLLPFYPSPLRDDGYDIADYEAVNPSYGAMEDVRRFVEEAHRRGLRVITELVINHTSDRHPWFQRARKAPPGSVERDFYVWSDSDAKWPETRIIFIDSEDSNWTWDEEAGAFYWHRFYRHQPDLNFDNPAVLEEVLRVMKFWLDLGVDGLRLDAIPYLVERDGTNNENLSETHVVLKKIRAALDAHAPGRMLLAEANQWPEDTRPYFGEGDECHMGFHFPLMPRMYMALAQEDRYPITDILRQTPAIPESCQWAIFLRNHDELTLEMVTESERDQMWTFYAGDARARINLGIRRRLAPLLENDRRKIELMNALLFSMPGTPVIYYGDEIGMGDNFYLGDRDGVRTPMQWTADRNAGFSRAKPQQLNLPVVMDPVYGYEAVNVEAQASTPGSLLNWMRRIIAIRKAHPAFGRGAFEFLYPQNRKVLAFIRTFEDEVALCVFNVSRSAQAVELDLSAYADRVPVEMESGGAFPPIGALPYLLTMPAYGFYWFRLAAHARVPDWHQPAAAVMPDFATIACRSEDPAEALRGEGGERVAREALPTFLPLQRWYGAKGEPIRRAALAVGPRCGDGVAFATARLTTAGGAQDYVMPLAALWGEAHLQFGAPTLSATVARLRRGNRLGALIDAATDPRLATGLVAMMRDGAAASEHGMTLRGEGTPALDDPALLEHIRPLGVEQSNLSIVLGDAAILKLYRRVQRGPQPEVDIARFLTSRTDFANTPAFLGAVTLTEGDAEPATVAACFAFVRNQGDGWSAIVDALGRVVEDRAEAGVWTDTEERDEPENPFTYPLDIVDTLGRRTGEMHRALATPTDEPGFGTAPVTARDVASWADDAAAQAADAFARLAALSERDDHAQSLLARRAEAEELLRALAATPAAGVTSRVHGDYHLGQALLAEGDWHVIDFEGEPRRSLAERVARASPMRDVAGMLRSFDYAAFAAIDRVRAKGLRSEEAEALAWRWRDAATTQFLDGYREGAGERGEIDGRLLRLFLLQKVFYEIGYEASNRPAWLSIPVRGALALLDGAAS